ncbi:MAG: hypothetical protein M9905_01675 [Rhizobiaceae bacterium]|nr:hypothetical protein [Rhizobiaceae bacterium]
MINFGTSAYLKLLALNPQPRDTEIRNRIWTNGSGGYDFHKAMRRIATEFAAGTEDWPTTRASLKSIKNPAERRSAIAATFALKKWIGDRSIRLLQQGEQKELSPNKLFSVKFSPHFEFDLEGVQTRVHIWNTKMPPLRLREAIGTLGLFCEPGAPKSIAVLSLRTNELFRPTDYETTRNLARLLAIDIEKRVTRVSEERNVKRLDRPQEKWAG